MTTAVYSFEGSPVLSKSGELPLNCGRGLWGWVIDPRPTRCRDCTIGNVMHHKPYSVQPELLEFSAVTRWRHSVLPHLQGESLQCGQERLLHMLDTPNDSEPSHTMFQCTHSRADGRGTISSSDIFQVAAYRRSSIRVQLDPTIRTHEQRSTLY